MCSSTKTERKLTSLNTCTSVAKMLFDRFVFFSDFGINLTIHEYDYSKSSGYIIYDKYVCIYESIYTHINISLAAYEYIHHICICQLTKHILWY